MSEDFGGRVPCRSGNELQLDRFRLTSGSWFGARVRMLLSASALLYVPYESVHTASRKQLLCVCTSLDVRKDRDWVRAAERLSRV